MLQGVLVIVFLAVATLIYAAYFLVAGQREVVLDRLKKNINHINISPDFESDEKVSAREQFEGIANLIAKVFYRKKYLEHKRKQLAQAAIMMKPQEFLMISVMTGMVIGGMAYAFSGNLFISLGGLVIGFKIPGLFLVRVKTVRMNKINEQLPEALSVLSNGLRAGFSFAQAMGVAARELDKPIAEEFSKVIRDNSIGKPMEEAMMELAERTGNEDIDMFVTALLIQRQVGGNLAEILDSISATIRDRIRIKGEIKTLTAEGRISAVVIIIMPIAIAVAISLLNPQYISVLVTTKIGMIMIGVALIMEIVGIYLIKKIITIDI